jgi:hypothetical protein
MRIAPTGQKDSSRGAKRLSDIAVTVNINGESNWSLI